MTYSLNRPPAGLSGFLLLIWPLVFVQLVALKAWVRRHYGPGVPYWFTVSRWGRVSLRNLPIDFAWGHIAPAPLQPAAAHRALFAPARRLLAALSPEARVCVAPVRSLQAPSVHVASNAQHPDTS